MRRALAVFLVLLAFAFAAPRANAVVSFEVIRTSVPSGNPLHNLTVGDTVTIDIRMSNPTGAAIFGIGGGVQGWDNSLLSFVSGEMTAGPFFCPTTACNTGLDNSLSFRTDENTGNFQASSGDVQSIAGVGNYLPIVQAISTTGRAGDGTRDPGLDGIVAGGDAQFRLVFVAVSFGVTTLSIGTNPSPTVGNVVVLAGGQTVQANNALLSITVADGIVPEPGTALLLALGLAGLAATGRRS